MIVPMKKVSMVVQAKDKDSALDSLRELGLVHLENFRCSSPKVEAVSAELNRVASAILMLDEFKPKKDIPAASLDGRQAVDRILGLKEEIQTCQDHLASLSRQIADLEKWGDFEPEDFKFLAQKGWHVRIYTAYGNQVENIPQDNVVVMHKEKNSVVFAHVTRSPASLEFEEFVPPAKSLGALKAEAADLLKRIDELKEELKQCCALKPSLKQYQAELESELEYQVAKANILEEGSLAAITGYIPADQVERLTEWARRHSVALAVANPGEDDAVPTLVRNPRWLQMIEPVFDFLGTVPGYRELNVSFFFFVFLVIFFAMIIGDAAYGAVFFVGGLLATGYSAVKKRKAPLLGQLSAVLGLATMVWGALNGSWFGSPELIRGTFLEKLVVKQFTEGIAVYTPTGELYRLLTGQDVLKLFCFVLALIQLTIAQVWNFLRELADRSLKALAQLGWIAVNFGLFYLVLSMVMYFDLDGVFATGGLISQTSIILILGGLGLVFLFGSQEGNFVKGLLGGLKDLLPTALDTVSAFGDIISYIRLFAVALAGAEIAASFNEMAGGLLKGNSFVLGILVLLLGHTLNFVLACLGVLVHGIRLNMLEFSGRLGIEWSGFSYKPFHNPFKSSAASAEGK